MAEMMLGLNDLSMLNPKLVSKRMEFLSPF
jgi:hypothetical protein